MKTELELWSLALSRVGDLTIQTDAAQTVTGATAANPVVLTSAAHGLASGRYVLLSGFATMTQVNGRVFRIAVLSSSTYQLVGEDGSGYTADTSGTATPLENTEAVRKTALAWPTVRDEVLRLHPWNAAIKSTRLARLASAKTVTGITQSSSGGVITSAAHGYSNGDQFLLAGIVGMTELNDRYQTAQNVTTNTLQISEDTSGYTAYSSGGTMRKALQPLRADFGYSNRFDLPSDFLRIVDVSASRLPWEVQGAQMRTDAGITVPIRYLYRVTDPQVFDSMLASVLAWRLALDLVEPLTQSNTKKEDLRALYAEALTMAKKADAQESSPSDFEDDEWLLARHGVEVSRV